MYDVIVVGARCAGASTAMLLARQGHRVLLVDRATFPSEIPHGHFIHRHGPSRLRRWGLLDRVVDSGCPAVTSMISDFGDFPLVGMNLVVDGVAMGYGPRRAIFDKILVDAAVEAGVELREGFTVDELTSEADRITGIRGRERGSAVTERAKVIVGADGRNSRLARTVRAPAYEAHPAVTCWYWSYWSGVAPGGLELYIRQGRFILVFPTHGGLTGVFVAFPSAELTAVRGDVEGHLLEAVDQVPELAERLRAGRVEERFRGASDLPNFLRRAYGPGWALVGDAGCHKDPLMALGMCDALRDAELLADTLHEGLSGERPVDDALADYERRRDEATIEDYRTNLARASFQPPPPEVPLLRRALRGDPEATRQYHLAFLGLVPPATFFNPENLGRIMGAPMPPAS